MSRVLLDLGFIEIYWYSVCIFLGVLCGSILIFNEAKKRKLNLEFLSNLIFFGIIFALIGARLYYCLFKFDYYSKYPLEILEVWQGGLAIHGGIILGGLFILFYCLKYKVKFFKITDILVPGVIVGQAIGRWGNFFNKEAFGKLIVSENPLGNYPEFIRNQMYITEGVEVPGYYQPTFLYESIWNMIGLVILLVVRKICKGMKVGQLTGLYFMWYSLGRFFIESLRSDSLMIGDTIKTAQVVSILLFVFGLVLFVLGFFGPKFENSYQEDFKDIKY